MANHGNTLLLIASKLGLGDEEKVLSKAAEFERLLQMKTTANSNITDTGRVVICLDLAAQMYGVELDMKTAVKYSGVKSSAYVNNRKVVQNLLELSTDRLTTAMVCAAVQCDGVQELADRLLAEYQATAKMEVDFSFPQYVCMAVYQACRINKVKVSKSKMIQNSRLKPAQWAKLDAEWTKFVDESFATIRKKNGRVGKNMAAIDDSEEMDVDLVNNKTEEPSEPQTEPYEVWMKRILDVAYSKVKTLQSTETNKQEHKKRDNKHQQKNLQDEDKQYKNDDTYREAVIEMDSPRRSPRKITKYEPYQNPNKSKGVRLLFPLDSTEKSPQKSEVQNYKNHYANREIVKEMDSVRRSPRKVTKYEPYESPHKSNGVRLLFPLDSTENSPQKPEVRNSASKTKGVRLLFPGNSLNSPQKIKSPQKSKSPSRTSRVLNLVFPANL